MSNGTNTPNNGIPGTHTITFPVGPVDVAVGRLAKSGQPVTHKVTFPNWETLLDNARHGADQRINDSLSSKAFSLDAFQGDAVRWRDACVRETTRVAAGICNGKMGRNDKSAELAQARADAIAAKAVADAAKAEADALRAELDALKAKRK